MLALTTVLRDELGAAAPTGDEFMDAIGGGTSDTPIIRSIVFGRSSLVASKIPKYTQSDSKVRVIAK